MAMIYPFMQSLREAAFPAPGHTVKIKSFIPERGTEVRTRDKTTISLKKPYIVMPILHVSYGMFLHRK